MSVLHNLNVTSSIIDTQSMALSAGRENEFFAIDRHIRSPIRQNLHFVRHTCMLKDCTSNPLIYTAESLDLKAIINLNQLDRSDLEKHQQVEYARLLSIMPSAARWFYTPQALDPDLGIVVIYGCICKMGDAGAYRWLAPLVHIDQLLIRDAACSQNPASNFSIES